MLLRWTIEGYDAVLLLIKENKTASILYCHREDSWTIAFISNTNEEILLVIGLKLFRQSDGHELKISSYLFILISHYIEDFVPIFLLISLVTYFLYYFFPIFFAYIACNVFSLLSFSLLENNHPTRDNAGISQYKQYWNIGVWLWSIL